MTQEMRQQAHPLHEAADVTRELMALVADENEALGQRNIDLVGQKINDKNRLAMKLERLIREAKKTDGTALDVETKRDAMALQAEMDAFQHVARKNILLLQSAHQVRADTLKLIQQTMSDLKPKAQTYNKAGTVNEGGLSSSLLNRTI